MLIVLTTISGVSQPVAKSIYSGTRVSTAKDFINRILDAKNQQELKEKYRPYFDQISLITAMRDNILHYGAVYNRQTRALIVSNERVAHTEIRLRRYEVTSALLDDLAHDTARSIAGLMLELIKDSAPPDSITYFHDRVASPWRYKPPPPIPLLPNRPQIPR
jgi:hypothetical protein